MSHRHTACVSALLVALSSATTASANTVPAAFQGKWVPAKATCDSPARVLVAADRLTLVNAADKEAFGGIEMAGPGYFPPGYRGISAVLFTEFSGNQPVIATFNFKERKGEAQVEFAAVTKGAAAAQQKAYNAQISKLNLAKRFPLNKVLLKKCAGA